MSWTRRDLLRVGATTAATALLAPGSLLRPPAARAAGAEPVIVLLFLRGGADWLNLVPPIGDANYYALRPRIAVPRGDALSLDGFFGFHPSLQPLMKHYRAGRLAVVDAFGLPTDTRSHFDAQDYVDSGVPGKAMESGWLGRYAARAGLVDPWAAVTLGPLPAPSIRGANAMLAFPSVEQFRFETRGDAPQRQQALERLAHATNDAWGRAARNVFAALERIGRISLTPRVAFPNTEIGNALRDVSLLIRARIGVRVAAVDMGGWDHHFHENWDLPVSASALAQALDAFIADLGAEISRTVVAVVSEFGRTAFENGSGGTDHGRGGAALVIGGAVRGGRVLVRGGWPGLRSSDLIQRRDLAVTTDTRDVFAEILRRHMGVSNLSQIFPGYTPRFLGLFG